MSSDVVTLSNKSYIILQSASDRSRRRKYFNTYNENESIQTGEITADESQLLVDLGIDSKMTTTLKMYLPTFFDNIHKCSSESNLVLNKNCNIPYYVLWSIMLANKVSTDERLYQNKLKFSTTPQLGVATDAEIIRQLRPKDVTDQHDKLFKLILTSNTNGQSLNDFARLFQLPTAERVVKPTLFTNEHLNTNIEYIQNIFKLILVSKKAGTGAGAGAVAGAGAGAGAGPVPPAVFDDYSSLANRLQTLDNLRTDPIYTFSQLGATCGTDALFTILLQADDIKNSFISNARQIFQKQIDNVLIHAVKRYINMLELESEHKKHKDTKRRKSVNVKAQHGHKILEEISDGKCDGVSRGNIRKYLDTLKQKLESESIPSSFNYFDGFEFKNNLENKLNKNINKIKAIYITHGVKASSVEGQVQGQGHAITILKIRNEWYISDNNVGLLHKITDSKFIKLLLYKLYNAENQTDELFELCHTSAPSLNQLKYFFEFKFGEKRYVYPNPSAIDFKAKVTASRTIVFASSNGVNSDILQMPSEQEYKTLINSLGPGAQSVAGADMVDDTKYPTGETLSDGNCFFSAIYRSARDHSARDHSARDHSARDHAALEKIGKCLELPTEDETAFIKAFREKVGNYYDGDNLPTIQASEGSVNTYLSFLDKITPTSENYIETIKAFPNWFKQTFGANGEKLGSHKEFTTNLAKQVRVWRNWVSEIEVRVIQEMLDKCDIIVRIMNTNNIKTIGELMTHDGDKIVLNLLNNMENHYVYFIIGNEKKVE